jgi:hypothetical protein
MMSTKLIVAAISASCVYAQDDWRFADPHSNVIGGLNWRAVMESSLGPTIRAGVLRSPVGASISNTLDTADRAKWSITAAEKDGKSTIEWVLALTGQFDPNTIGAQLADLGYAGRPYGSTVLFVPTRESSRAVQLAMVDPNTLLLGDAEPLRRAMDRIAERPSLDGNPLFAVAQSLETSNDVWVTGTGSPLALYQKKVPGFVAGLPAVNQYSVGLSLINQPSLRLSLGTASAVEAGVFVQLMRLLPYLAKLKPGEHQLLQEIWAQSEFTQEAGMAKAMIPLDLLVKTYLQ